MRPAQPEMDAEDQVEEPKLFSLHDCHVGGIILALLTDTECMQVGDVHRRIHEMGFAVGETGLRKAIKELIDHGLVVRNGNVLCRAW